MVIEQSFFYIGSVKVGYYLILMTAGFLIAAAIAFPKAKRCGLRIRDVFTVGVFAAVGGFFGAKLLYIAVSLPAALPHIHGLSDVLHLLGGGTFYGGLLFGALTVLLYCLLFHRPIGACFDLLASGIALGLAVGRIGCFIAGCCYGVETDGPFFVVYHNSPSHPVGDETHYLPVQLIESMYLLVIFAVCETVFYKTKPNGNSALLFGILYSLARFALECFRGDLSRGLLFGVSTSQYISFFLFLLCYGIVMYKLKKRYQRMRGTVPRRE